MLCYSVSHYATFRFTQTRSTCFTDQEIYQVLMEPKEPWGGGKEKGGGKRGSIAL